LPITGPRLNDFEGDGYQRVAARVRLSDGREVTAQEYVARGSAAT
jgi:hypothetical protein